MPAGKIAAYSYPHNDTPDGLVSLLGSDSSVFAIDHNGWSTQNRIVVWVGVGKVAAHVAENEDYPIWHMGSPVKGTPVCLSGARRGRTVCGDVTKTRRANGKGADVKLCSIPGDSGGPVFKNRTAYGIMSGRYLEDDQVTCRGFSIFTGVYSARDATGYAVLRQGIAARAEDSEPAFTGGDLSCAGNDMIYVAGFGCEYNL